MIVKRPPNLSPRPRSEKELRLLLKQAQQYEAADIARRQWEKEHPKQRPEVKLLPAITHPASAERAQQLMTMLQQRGVR